MPRRKQRKSSGIEKMTTIWMEDQDRDQDSGSEAIKDNISAPAEDHHERKDMGIVTLDED